MIKVKSITKTTILLALSMLMSTFLVGQNTWELDSFSGALCPNILDDECLSHESTASILANPKANADPDAKLIFSWYAPDGSLLTEKEGFKVGAQYQSTLFGINPQTSTPYLCKAGTYRVELRVDGGNIEDTATLELMEGNPYPASIEKVDDENLSTVNQTIDLRGIPDPAADVLFHNWFKVDYSTDPPSRIILGNEALITLDWNDPNLSFGTYLYSYIDRNSLCISEALIDIEPSGEPCDVYAGPDVSLNCENPTVILDGSLSGRTSDANYEWRDPNGTIISTEFTVEVSEPGTYTFVVYEPLIFCPGTDYVEVTEDLSGISTLPAAIEIVDNERLENGNESIDLRGIPNQNANVTAENWYKIDNSTSPPENIPVGSERTLTLDWNNQDLSFGTYKYTYTDGNSGCISEALIDIEIEDRECNTYAGPDVNLSCTNSSVILDGSLSGHSDMASFQWRDETGAILSNDFTLEVSEPGTYTFIVNEPLIFCLGLQDEVVVGQDLSGGTSLPASIEIVDDESLWIGNPSIDLKGIPDPSADVASENWYRVDDSTSPPTHTLLSNERILTLDWNLANLNYGTYLYSYEDKNSTCISEASIDIEVIDQPCNVYAGPDVNLNCVNSSVILDGSLSGYSDNVSFEWRDENDIVISTELTVEVSQPGTYQFMINEPLVDCTQFGGKDFVVVGQDFDQPFAFFEFVDGSPILSCDNPTITVRATSLEAGDEILWEGPFGFQSNENPITVDQIGDYRLTVTAENGCFSSGSFQVISDFDFPNVVASAEDEISCGNDVQIFGSSDTPNVGFLWTGPNGFTSDLPNPFVSLPGIYTLTVTAPNGCQTIASVEIFANPELYIPDAGEDVVLTCCATTVILDASASCIPTGSIITWLLDGAILATGELTLEVSQPGIYEFNIYGADDTSESDFVEVSIDCEIPSLNYQFINGTDAVLNSCDDVADVQFTEDPNLTYTWLNLNGEIIHQGAIYSITTEGEYSVEVENAATCAFNTTSIFITRIGTCNPTLEIQTAYGVLCRNILDETCASPSSIATVIIEDVEESDSPSLEIKWTGPNGLNLIDNNVSISGPMYVFNLSGLDSNTGQPYLCSEGIYEYEVYDLNSNWAAVGTFSLEFYEAMPAVTGYIDENTLSFCNAQQLTIFGEPSNPDIADVLFQAWYKVDYTQTPPKLNIIPEALGGNESELTLQLNHPLLGPGTYVYSFIDRNSLCPSESLIEVFYDSSDEEDECHLISGVVFLDENSDCEFNSPELKLSEWMVELESDDEIRHRMSLEDGFYSFYTTPGNYTLRLVPLNSAWEACDPVKIEIPEGGAQDPFNINLGAQANGSCNLPKVNLIVPSLTRCFDSQMFVYYSNVGNQALDDVYIELEMDEFHSIQTSEVAFTPIGDNKYRFDIGSLEVFENGKFEVVVLTSCDAYLGQTHCFTTEVFPHEDCDGFTGEWDGSSIVVEGKEAQGEIEFTISNVGSDMSESLNWFIIEDDVLMKQGRFQLNALNNNEIVIPANCDGKTYRIEAEQSRFHPGNSYPSLSVEGCSGDFTPGLVNLFAQDDENLYKDIDCVNNIGSFDPNDKQGFPFGSTEKRCVDLNRHIDYLIRFQNTGTAPAFTVVITDQIDENLDLNTLEIVGSSHDFIVDLDQSGQLTFTFNDINLPDIKADEKGSNGFIKYKILPKKDIVLGTQVNNQAKIYFDFNEPVITNETLHTIDDNCIDLVINSSTNDPETNQLVVVYPSPFMDEFSIRFKDESMTRSFRMLLYDTKGRLIANVKSEEGFIQYENSELTAGVYFYELRNLETNSLTSQGKVICIID